MQLLFVNAKELGCYGADFGIRWVAGTLTMRFDILVIGLYDYLHPESTQNLSSQLEPGHANANKFNWPTNAEVHVGLKGGSIHTCRLPSLGAYSSTHK